MLPNLPSNTGLNYSSSNNLKFSGKKFVMQKILGERVLIPKAVHEAKRCSKIIEIKVDHHHVEFGNGVCIGKDTFLTVKHLFNEPYSSVGVGKLYPDETHLRFNVNKAEKIKSDFSLDLAIVKLKESINKFSQSIPVKLAENSPTPKDTVYLLGSNGFWEGQKVIPFKITAKSPQLRLNRFFSNGAKANYFEIMSNMLYKKVGEVHTRGLSGSPVVNAAAELVGIAARGQDRINNLFIIDLDTIKSFLTGINKPSLLKRLSNWFEK